MLLKLKTHFIKYSLLKHLYSYSKPKEERVSRSELLVSYEWFLNCAMYIVRMYAPPPDSRSLHPHVLNKKQSNISIHVGLQHC